jgi:hypothetical protein
MTTSRRVFMMQVVAGGSALVAGQAMAQAKLEETDPQAVALSYKHDGTKIDTKKFPKHELTHNCANCQLYQGKATDPWGGCPLFGTKQVNAKGWCSAWVKKA